MAQQEQVPNQEYPRFSKIHAGTTKQSEMAARLLECEQLLETTLDMAHLGIWKLTIGTGDVYCSARGKAHWGYAAEVQLNSTMLSEHLISAEGYIGKTTLKDGDIVQNMIEHLQKQKVYNAEWQVKWPNDSIHWIEIRSKMPTNEQGKAGSIIGITRDVTECKQEQQQKNAYLSKVRHELKTPLTTIKGFTQLIRRRIKKLGLDEQIDMLNRLEEQVDILNTQINEMKDASKFPRLKPPSPEREGFIFRTDQPFSLLSETSPSDSSYDDDPKSDR